MKKLIQKKGKLLMGMVLCLGIITLSFSTKYLAEEPTTMPAAQFKIYSSLAAVLPDFDFDAKCEIQSFELIYTPSKNDPISLYNQGAKFSKQVLDAVAHAKSGDQFVFSNLYARCPGDIAARRISSLVVVIK